MRIRESVAITTILLSLFLGNVWTRPVIATSTPAPFPTVTWSISTPEEQGMDSKKLNQMIELIDEQDIDIDSVLVIRNGYIVFEEYPGILDQDDKHSLHSVTKSFTSALVGIAIDKGFIDSVDQKVVDFFPERTIKNLDSWKQKLTLENLLTMTTGLTWDEWTYPYSDSRNDLIKMLNSYDPVQHFLDLPMIYEPGTEWVYSTGASHLLSAIIQQMTGYNTFDFAREFLLEPLGITDVQWDKDRRGVYYGGHSLSLKPRDMAKFGYLYLNNGTWDGEQIVSPEWVVESSETRENPYNDEFTGYGYQWWTNPHLGVYFAAGRFAQKIYIAPALDLVAIFTASIPDGSPDPEYKLLSEYILPAVEDDKKEHSVIFSTPAIIIGLMSFLVLRKRKIKEQFRKKREFLLI
ncbi:MAG: serine hydrolase domain-containing protein [Candidatus Odinarchaeota archaeon]